MMTIKLEIIEERRVEIWINTKKWYVKAEYLHKNTN